MTTQPSGLVFDFGENFVSSAERIVGEREERADLVKGQLSYGIQFLDDILRGILPHDLILLGAETGVGKTEAAKQIAMHNALLGKRVHYFALEAEPREIERRIKFALQIHLLRQSKEWIDFGALNYPDWFRDKCPQLDQYSEKAERMLRTNLKTLFTYYRGSSFGHDDIKRLLLAIRPDTDLVILDHIHYVDIDDENENRGFKRTVKMIRDITLGMGKPMILVAHLRKKQGNGKTAPIVPAIDDFHGSSDLTKICTHAIMLAPARGMRSATPGISNTFLYVPKDRPGGATRLVALCGFELATRTYTREYTLGRATPGGDQFEVIDSNDRPYWAKHHQGLSC